MNGMVGLSYMNYIGGIHVGSAIYTRTHGDRGAWAVGLSYINYGSMKEADLQRNHLSGHFSAADAGLSATYSYDLSDRWRGGLSMKVLYSAIAEYSAFGLAADAGLSYFDEEADLSVGIALKNIHNFNFLFR